VGLLYRLIQFSTTGVSRLLNAAEPRRTILITLKREFEVFAGKLGPKFHQRDAQVYEVHGEEAERRVNQREHNEQNN
jgi:hypothetical protein